MKMNWGTGILVLIILFFITMFVMVYIAFNQRVDLVTKNYYEKELAYQKDINMQQNELDLKNSVIIEQIPGKISITFPTKEVGMEIKGEVRCYRPADSRDDKLFAIAIDSLGQCKVPLTNMRSGLWNVIVNWEANGKEFMTQKKLIIE